MGPSNHLCTMSYEPTDIRICSEGPASLDELQPLWLALHHHHQHAAPGLGPYIDDDKSWAVRRASYRQWLALPDSFLLVARCNRRAVGYAMVRVDEPGGDWTDTWIVGDRVAELETLVVTPEHRGRGVGSALLDRMETVLAERGIHDVVIGVVPGNDSARQLYERRGYKPTWTVLSRFASRGRGHAGSG